MCPQVPMLGVGLARDKVADDVCDRFCEEAPENTDIYAVTPSASAITPLAPMIIRRRTRPFFLGALPAGVAAARVRPVVPWRSVRRRSRRGRLVVSRSSQRRR